MPKSFCIAPFTGMRQNAYGDMAPCPFGAGEWKIGHLSVKEKFFYHKWVEMRETFLKGGRPQECHRCWVEEDAGKKSMRQWYLDERADLIDLVQSGKWKDGPVSVVWKTSNVCNLACKTCSAAESSKYTREGEAVLDLYNDKSSLYVAQSKPTHISEEDAISYADFSENLRFLEFFGGEPLLNKTHEILLDKIVQKGKASQIQLYYSTNTTLFPSLDLIKLWSKFKKVKLGLSIDGVGEGFHYMRWPGKFSVIEENLNKYKTIARPILQEQGVELDIVLTMTASSLNVFNLAEPYAWGIENVGACYISLVQSPSYQAIVNIPDQVKPLVAKKLEESNFIGEFKNIINFMNSKECDQSQWRKFVITTERQDRYRNMKMAQVFPEYWSLIKDYYLPYAEDLSAEAFRK